MKHLMMTLNRINRSRRSVAVIIGLCAAALLSGCRWTSSSAPKAVSADTWAGVDGHEISRAEVEKNYQRVRDPRQALSDEEIMNAKLNLLSDLIVQQILLAKAETLKLTVADSEVDTAYANAKKDMT